MKQGERYGALTLRYKEGNYWVCSCDCGNQNVIAEAKNLLNHCYPCCGKCRRLGTWAIKEAGLRKQKALNIEHQEVVKKNKKHYYSETSRGYIKSSKKETIIYKKLTQLGKIFETEKEFGVCYPGSYTPFRFDFCVASSESPVGFYLIEYDGQQHQKPIKIFGGEAQFKKQQWRDQYKNQWCKNNNIPLIRITGNVISDADLELKTTEFRAV